MKNNLKINITKNMQIAVLGLGKFGRSVARELVLNNGNVLCCDKKETVVQEIAHDIIHIVHADASSDDFLEKMGIGNFDVVIVAFSKDFETAILTVMKLKEKNVPYVIVKASDERHKTVLEKIGADLVLLPEVVMGERLAHQLLYKDPLTHIHESDIFNIEQIKPKKEWLDKSLREINLTRNEGINVLGIIRDETLVSRINSETKIFENDILIIIKTLDSTD